MRHSTIQSVSELPQTFASLLLEKGILSQDQIDIAQKEQKLKTQSFEDTLTCLGFLSEGALAEALALESGFDKINLKQFLFDPSLKSLIPREQAERYCLIPLSLEEGVLRVALSDIYNLAALDFLQHKISYKVVPLIASESDILEAIDGFYGYDLSIRGLLKEIEDNSANTLYRDDIVNPTIRLVNSILIDAIKLKASDIHFEPEGAFMRLRYRIDGILTQVCTLHASYWPAICVRLKVMAEMNIAESRHPQNGRMTFYCGPREIDLRLAAHPTVHGENIVVRILDKSRSLMTLDELGYSEEVIGQIKKALQRPEGIFIITGPTGCGKTTSLYSLLKYINKPQINIMTLEEPVEYQLPFIRQSNVKEKIGMSFAEGVKSILRQDPDIILIGEIRDSGTAQMALRAAMTGHQIFTTLHTNDALGAIHRLVDLDLTRPMLASHLMAIVAQRLVRRLCEVCKKPCKMKDHEASLLGLKKPETFFVSQGCKSCRETGFKGRLAIAEVVVFDQDLDEIMLNSSSKILLKTCALKRGYIPMAQDARKRILKGDTSLEEVLRIVDLREGR
jgi:type II secretory ATPase GspE/PulE/Tfp pilus assembly ATPase PilB-like protein